MAAIQKTVRFRNFAIANNAFMLFDIVYPFKLGLQNAVLLFCSCQKDDFFVEPDFVLNFSGF